jgi:biofilm PGA synthesis N-glycosyltransferase PgaC
MTNIFSNGKDMGAVAGSVLARNTRKNWMTRIQEWDYFNGIASVKRTQALYEGTLVAQGAFSAYRTHVLRELGGWKETVGEDIVLTWGIIDLGYKVGYAENAIALTDVPTTYKQFFSQRKRWSRGLVEAFRYYPSVLWKPRKNMPFIYLNLTFPYTDFMFLFFFIPGLIAALVFEYYLLVGFMTLLLLPIALLGNIIMFLKQKKVINDANFKLRHNKIGFVMYILFYQLIMAPAALSGYFAEIFRTKKTWGTK